MKSRLASSRLKTMRIIKHPVFIVFTIIFVVATCFTFWVLVRLHEARDPQGEANSICNKNERVSISNDNGVVISAHETICSGLGSTAAMYVHIRPENKAESKQTLVFRYDEDNTINGLKAESLSYKWIDSHTVQISVGSIYDKPSKQLQKINGVKIIYNIKNVEPPLVVS